MGSNSDYLLKSFLFYQIGFHYVEIICHNDYDIFVSVIKQIGTELGKKYNLNNYGRLLGKGRVSRRNAKSGMEAASLISYFFAVVLFTMPHKNAEYS